MKLYEGWRSSASWRVRWALALKKIEYDSVLIDIDKKEHLELAINPMRQIPTLELDDGRLLTESVAIIEWLEEAHPTGLLPADPWERARARALVQIVNAGIHPLQNTGVRLSVSDDVAVQHAWASRWIERGLNAFEQHLAELSGAYCIGDSITMADLFLIPQVRNADRFGADISSCRRARAIYDACMATPEAQATDPIQVKKQHDLRSADR